MQALTKSLAMLRCLARLRQGRLNGGSMAFGLLTLGCFERPETGVFESRYSAVGDVHDCLLRQGAREPCSARRVTKYSGRLRRNSAMECSASLALAQSTRWLATMLMSRAPAVVAIRFASASDNLVGVAVLFGSWAVVH
jgi:hypothetical protein